MSPARESEYLRYVYCVLLALSGMALQQALWFACRRTMRDDALSRADFGVCDVWRQQDSSAFDSKSPALNVKSMCDDFHFVRP